MDYLQLQNLFISIHEIFFAKYNKVKRIPFFETMYSFTPVLTSDQCFLCLKNKPLFFLPEYMYCIDFYHHAFLIICDNLLVKFCHFKCQKINVRENRRGNHEWTVQRHLQINVRENRRGNQEWTLQKYDSMCKVK